MEIKIEMSQTGPSTTKADIRHHEILVDRPEAKGGTDQGPMGGEILLAALGGCFSSNLLAAIKSRKFDIKNIKLKITGTLDGHPIVYTRIDVEVSATGDDLKELTKLVTISDRACISSNTLRSSNVDVHFRVANK